MAEQPVETADTPRAHHPDCPALYFTDHPERCRCIFLAALDKPRTADDRHCRVGTCSGVATPEHSPCCSSHGDNLCCRHYRAFHFVEVRPCCGTDAKAVTPPGQEADR